LARKKSIFELDKVRLKFSELLIENFGFLLLEDSGFQTECFSCEHRYSKQTTLRSTFFLYSTVFSKKIFEEGILIADAKYWMFTPSGEHSTENNLAGNPVNHTLLQTFLKIKEVYQS